MRIEELITDTSALNEHSYTISPVPSNTFDDWAVERITSMRNTTYYSYNGLTINVRPKDTTVSSWDSILVELVNRKVSGYKEWNRRLIDLNIYYNLPTDS